MSASSKKKLRREQENAAMTERQIAEQKEAKKLKTLTRLFVAVMVLIIVIAVGFAGVQGYNYFVNHSGVLQRNTAAITVGDVELSNAELNYFYIDSVNEFLNYYGSYLSIFGLDTTKPLNEQVVDEQTGETWADNFLSTALDNVKEIYALANEAEKNGFTLSEDELTSIENDIINMEAYATMYGYENAEGYLKAVYGSGTTLESYREYYKLNSLASAYYSAYYDGLTYDNAALRAADSEAPAEYSNFSYNTYYLSTSSFLEGGTTDENGTTTYSDEEKAASVKAAEAAANALISEDIKTVEDLDAAISALEINAEAETPVTSTAYEDVAYGSVTSTVQEWVTDASRKAGDMTVIANEYTTTAEDGTETSTINGYYVVRFNGMNDNNYPLANVRHILISFEGGTYDSATQSTVYTDAEKTAAQEEAAKVLDAWKNGDANEESFAALAMQTSTDSGSVANGGLYEDVYPGQMVTNFNDWCFAEGRKAGDTGIVESPYGYHVMYYVGDSETLYRDYLIDIALREEATSTWFAALTEATVVTELNTDYVSKNLVLSQG